MDNNILDYFSEGIKLAGIIGGGYFSTLITSYILGRMPWNRRIDSQEELELLVREECPKLGLNPKELDVFYGKYNISCAGKINGRETLNLSGFFRPTKHVVRHEYIIYLRKIAKIISGKIIKPEDYFTGL